LLEVVAARVELDGIYNIIFNALFQTQTSVEVHMLLHSSSGEAQAILPVPHLVHVVGHEEVLQVEPCEQPGTGKEQPLPVHDPLHHGLTAPVSTERVVLEDIKDGPV